MSTMLRAIGRIITAFALLTGVGAGTLAAAAPAAPPAATPTR